METLFNLTLYSNTPFYKPVLNYIYTKNKETITDFEYISESTLKPFE